jgi:hypothetical protein
MRLKARSANLVLILDILLVWLGYAFYRKKEGHLGGSKYDFIKRAKKYLEKHRYEVKYEFKCSKLKLLSRGSR